MNNYTVRQKKIVEVARKIITTQGMQELTIRELAKELKLTEGAIYRHFKSKKGIIKSLIDDIEETLFTAVELAAMQTSQPIEKLRNILLSHLSYAEERKGVSFLVISETINIKDKKLQESMYSIVRKYVREIEDVLQEGVSSKIFRGDLDTLTAGIAFFGLVQSVVTIWALSNFNFSLRRKYTGQLFDLYLKGVM